MQEDAIPAARLRLFLVAVRLTGLVLALTLTNMHQVAAINVPPEYNNVKPISAFAVILYHVIAGAASLRVSGALGAAVMLVDVFCGVALTWVFGQAYFILSYALPVLQCSAYFGRGPAIFLAVIGGCFYGGVLALPMLSQAQQASVDAALAARANASLVMVAVQLAFSWLMLYVCNIAVGMERGIGSVLSEAAQEKDMLYQQIQSKAQEIGKIYAEVGQRETLVLDMKSKQMELERAKLELEDQLVAAVEDQDRARSGQQKMEKVYDEQQERFQNEMRRQRGQWEREYFISQKKLERETRLLALYRELTGSLLLNDTLLTLTSQIQSLLPSQSCVIWLVDEVDGHKELFPEVAASPYTEAFRNRVLQLGEEAPGWCAERRRTLKIDDGNVTVEGVTLSTLAHYERSAVISPLATPDAILGAVYLGRADSGEFTPEDQELLGRICELASLALHNSLDYQRRINRGLQDGITNLYNGLYLEERMREELNRGRRYTYPVSLILVDVDGFSKAHEALGDTGAEQVLNEIADVLRAATRETDVPARFDGDDFGVLCVHTDREKAFAIAERIRAGTESRMFGPGANKIKLTVSVGVAGVPHDATNEELLQKRATDGLQMARSKGGNKVCYWDG